VVLNHGDDSAVGQTDYINANYIDGFRVEKEYIAAQGPLPETIVDFWQMVWESETSTIVMLTNLEEKARAKCAQYWPDMGSGALTSNNLVVTVTDEVEFTDHVIRDLHITKTGEASERTIKQFHYTAWPDFGTPADPSGILSLLNKVNKWSRDHKKPKIVHCSAGVGRSGTYISIDIQIQSIQKNKELNIFNCVTTMREDRCLLVQTEEQYVFVHETLLDYIDCGDTEVEANELKDHIRLLAEQAEPSASDSNAGMTRLMEEFIQLAKADRKDESLFSDAKKDDNVPKNRHKNILPYNDTRVKVFWKGGMHQPGDYINCSRVEGYTRAQSFIATQAPMMNTLTTFWRMIWQENTCAVVMLMNDDADMDKFPSYWCQASPTGPSPLKTGEFIVDATTTTTHGEYIVRELKVTNTTARVTRVVNHYQFTGWPEEGVPESAFGMIDLIGTVQKSVSEKKNIVVHCSSGVGRTGVYIVLTNLIERLKMEGVADVYSMAKRMRRQRAAILQTMVR
jgi:netrin-G3 ligand